MSVFANAANAGAAMISVLFIVTWTPVLTYTGGFEVVPYLLLVTELLLPLNQVHQ